MIKALSASLLALATTCLAAAPRVITLSNGEWPPIFSARLPGGGIMSQLVTEAFRTEGIEVRYVYLPWMRAYEEARSGRYDGTVGLAPNPERLQWFDFSDPVMNAEMVFFQRREQRIDWNTLSDLAGYRIGITHGNYYSDEFAALQKAGRLRIDATGNDEIDNLNKLLRARIDLFPIERHVGLFLLNRHFGPLEREHIFSDDKAFWIAPLHLLISHATPQRQRLLQQFNQGLARLKASGRYQHIIETGLTALPTRAE